MSSKHRLTRSFRTLSAICYLLNTIVAVRFAWEKSYLHWLVGGCVAAACLIMLSVAMELPAVVVSRLERSRIGELLFTFRGRYIVDFVVALFLFAMGLGGVLLGLITLMLIMGIRFLGVKQPDAFNEIFRQSDVESQGDSYTLESDYNGGNVAVPGVDGGR